MDNSDNIIVTAQRRDAPARDAAVAVTVMSTEQIEGTATRSGEAQDAASAAQPVAQAGPAESVNGVREDAAIATADWNPARPWIAAFDAAGANWPAEVERQRVIHGTLPLFWFDLAEWQYRKGRVEEARRAVVAALDLPSRDNQTLAIVAARLQRYGDLDRAIALVEQLMDRESERPQPPRTLAILLMQRAEASRVAGRQAAARADLHRAITLLADAVLTVRREMPLGFAPTTLMDANLAVQRFRALGGQDHDLPPALVRMLDSDIRVVVEWNTPRTDLDLWVTQPNGEAVGYSHRLALDGGQLTADVTTGYGPEEFLLHVAGPGTYTIRAHTFRADRNNPNGPSTLAARIIRNFGRPNQSEELVDIEMNPDDGGQQMVGSVVIR